MFPILHVATGGAMGTFTSGEVLERLLASHGEFLGKRDLVLSVANIPGHAILVVKISRVSVKSWFRFYVVGDVMPVDLAPVNLPQAVATTPHDASLVILASTTPMQSWNRVELRQSTLQVANVSAQPAFAVADVALKTSIHISLLSATAVARLIVISNESLAEVVRGLSLTMVVLPTNAIAEGAGDVTPRPPGYWSTAAAVITACTTACSKVSRGPLNVCP